MKKQQSLKEWIIWTLRKASYRWPPRQQALREASASRIEYEHRVGEVVSARVRNFYRCAKCRYVFSRKGVSADHIEPVIDPRRGWQGWDEYIARLFCGVEGFQIICGECHDEKTERERAIRTRAKREAKGRAAD